MKKIIILIISLSCITGCSTSRPYQAPQKNTIQRIQITLPTQTPTHIMGNITGKIYIKNPHNTQQYFAKNTQVILNPINLSSQQWYQEVCTKGHILTGKMPLSYQQQLIKTTTNEQGQFIFQNIPTGQYYLVSRAYWLDKDRYQGPVQYGGLMVKIVNITAGEHTINLDNKNACPYYFDHF